MARSESMQLSRAPVSTKALWSRGGKFDGPGENVGSNPTWTSSIGPTQVRTFGCKSILTVGTQGPVEHRCW